VSFDLELTGRRALVTAGTKGVGAAVVEVPRNAGATVVATARAIPADARTDVHYIAADITTAAGCTSVAQGVLDRLGGIDILVNVLGGSNAPAGGFAALDDDAWVKELDVNLMPASASIAHSCRRCSRNVAASSCTSPRSSTNSRSRNPPQPMLPRRQRCPRQQGALGSGVSA
jgi:NAD(P)-dependent dehydrogenase (short-subunit alcohol dehydrogenase family)